jgi:murein L,D-transpeptidase YafK
MSATLALNARMRIAPRTGLGRLVGAVALVAACVVCVVASVLHVARAQELGGSIPAHTPIDRLRVSKSEGVLQAFSGTALVATLRAAMGRGGRGPKRMEGDGRTPEGSYLIDSRHRSRQFHRFLHVSYPNTQDRVRYREGRRDGTIPRGVGIGGDIGVHGTPAWAALIPFSREVGWTEGCIAVSSPEAEQLYRAVVSDAAIEIVP